MIKGVQMKKNITESAEDVGGLATLGPRRVTAAQATALAAAPAVRGEKLRVSLDRGLADREARRPTRNRGGRTARLGTVAVGGAMRWAGDRLDSRGSAEDRRRRRGERVVATVDSLVDQLASLRGAAMKAGQVLSTVEFPGLDDDQSARVQARLASLRDSVPPVDWKQMRRVMARDWGQPPEQVLQHIETEPTAAASIGQVYRGRTRDGREVAIKVQYPGVA